MPLQFTTSRASLAAGKKPYSLASTSSPAKKIARPTSAPNLMALSAAKITTPAVASAPKKIARPVSSSNVTLTAPSATKSRLPSSKITPKKPMRPASGFMAAPRHSAESVHPAWRLTCGTAIYVRTRYVHITERCCHVIWLLARVVSASDAYHYIVKYVADLHAMFASKVVRVPVGHVREVTHRAAAAQAERSKKREAPKEEEPYW